MADNFTFNDATPATKTRAAKQLGDGSYANRDLIVLADGTDVGSVNPLPVAVSGGATAANQVAANTKLDALATALATNHADELQLHTDLSTTLHADLAQLHTDLTTATPAGSNQIGTVGLVAGAAKIGIVTTDQTTHGTTDLVAADITKVAGAAIAQGHGLAATAVRVELPTDGTGVVGLNAGTALVGKLGLDQTTPGTTNGVAIIAGQNGVAAGAGAVGATVQRVTLASDDPAVAVLGAKTDAKSAATDATSISAMSVWKQISASIQQMVFGAGTAAAAQRTTLASDDPAVAALGATSGVAVVTDTAGTIQQYMRGLIKQWTAGTLVIGAGANLIGKFAIDQTTPGTTNGVAIIAGQNGVAAGAGAVGATVQRVTLASDDPAVAVLGAKTDAKSAATDATSISAMSVWKQISASIQQMVFGAGTAAAAQRTTLASDDPAVAALGATSGVAVVTDTAGTIQQYMRGLIKQWTAGTLVIGAGANLIGKFAIDQTTPGTTNGVQVNALPQATFRVAVTPTVTAATYAATKVIGGIMTFASILAATTFAGVLQSIEIKFKGSAQTVGFYVSIFTASPSGTFTDTNTAAIVAGDTALLLGIYHVVGGVSVLGTHTILNLDGIGKAIVGASTSLYVVVTPDATTAALGSTSDMTVALGILQG